VICDLRFAICAPVATGSGSEGQALIADHVSLEWQHGFQAVAFLDEFRQRLSSGGFTVSQDDLRF
jgi:hypothetical protein